MELRAHSLLAEAPLHDAWSVDLPGSSPERSATDVLALASSERLARSNVAVSCLFGLRAFLGRVFGWDRDPPGASPESFVHRLSSEERASSLLAPGTPQGPFHVLHVSAREAILEIQNATVHAFSVFALLPRPEGQRLVWGIHVLPVGRITSWYMRVIDPFRRWIIYPAVLRYLREGLAGDEGGRTCPTPR